MQQLEKEFTHQGHNLVLIERTDRAGIWQTSRECESTPGFIVAKITKNQATTRIMPNGKEVSYAAKESLPGESSFGTSAWFFRSINQARASFSALAQRLESSLTQGNVSA